MIVIADTSPLNYLILIGQDDLLQKLFGRVIIPQAVFDELKAEGAALQVNNWINNLPTWVEMRPTSLVPHEALHILDLGEIEAILLAQELTADLLLVDDKQARLAATNLGIAITGTLGILDRASQNSLIGLKTVMSELQKTSFHVAEDLVQKLLEDDELRKSFK